MADRIRKAGHAVETAVRNGTLYKRNSCQQCRMIGKVEAHHHKGYAPEHWLDVEWLCVMCHRKADAEVVLQNLTENEVIENKE
jgi:RecJ-like exonuclease